MDSFSQDELAIIEQFGNHTRRYRFQIAKNWEEITYRLRKKNLNIEEYFTNLWPETEYQLMLFEQLAESKQQKLELIRSFFAFHYLKLNLDCIFHLREQLSEKLESPFVIYRQALLKIRQIHFSLCRGMINRLSFYNAPQEHVGKYVFFNVGSLVDHEDLDVGVIYEGSGRIEVFDAFVSKLSQHFFKAVTHLHFYLAEALNVNHYGAGIKTYFDYVNDNAEDIVFVSQILGATRLTGDMELFFDFKARIVERFFSDNNFRLNYIESSLNEIDRLCEKPLSKLVIYPKAECYRIFTMLASALRVAFQIHRGNIWETFDQFLRIDHKNRIFYELLKDSYAFIQILRYLYTLYISQKDEIVFNDAVEGEWLDNIAAILGMNGRYQLHDDYYYIAKRGRESAQYLSHHMRQTFLR